MAEKNIVDSFFPIGVFDSGVGGLTVIRALREQLPNELYCYFGDTARVPYGTKSSETVRRYSAEITRFLMSHDSKMIVVACNTASSVALDIIRDTFSGPVIGVVDPGVRAALRVTKHGRIGIIGTKSTIRSGTYQQRLLQHDQSLHLTAQDCPLFVPLVEEGWDSDPITEEIARRYLQPLIENKVDVVILGCTHYPLLENVIRKVMGENVILVNSADEVTLEVKSTLDRLQLFSTTKKQFKDLFYASDDIARFSQLFERISEPTNAKFVEVPADYFNMVQEVYRFKGTLFPNRIQWFEPIQ